MVFPIDWPQEASDVGAGLTGAARRAVARGDARAPRRLEAAP
jgi:hypothetical protein